MGTKMAAKWSS